MIERVNKTSVFSVVAVAAVALSGCSMNRFAVNRAAGILGEAALTFNAEPDYELAKEAMPANLKMIEGLHRSSPENAEILTLLAQGYCSYSFAFLEDSGQVGDLERAKRLYQRGYRYGLAALPAEIRQLASGSLEEFGQSVARLGKGEVAPLFWSAYCLGNWVNLNKADVAAVAELARVEVMMRQVLALDEKFYNGSAHLFYGIYYGSRPKMLGGNPAKAKENFERVVSITDGKFLLAKVFMAQFYAVPTQDEALFDTLLKEVASAPSDLYPEESLANRVAVRRAAKLAASKKDLF